MWGDALYFQGEEPGLLTGLSLDEIGISLPAWMARADEDVEVERVGIPEGQTRLVPAEGARVVQRVIDLLLTLRPARISAELLAGAALSPLYTARVQVRAHYQQSSGLWATPHWLPAYGYLFLLRQGRSAEGSAHLRLLERVASLAPPAGTDPAWRRSRR